MIDDPWERQQFLQLTHDYAAQWFPAGGSVADQETRDVIRRSLAAVGDGARMALMGAGWTYRLTLGPVTDHPLLWDRKDQSVHDGRRWSDLGGVVVPEHRAMFVNVVRLWEGGSVNTILHETGHGLDYLLAVTARDDVKEFHQRIAPEASVQEWWAEEYARTRLGQGSVFVRELLAALGVG